MLLQAEMTQLLSYNVVSTCDLLKILLIIIPFGRVFPPLSATLLLISCIASAGWLEPLLSFLVQKYVQDDTS